ncbi:MAG: metal-dependent hydrolase, partial [Peptostreptococcaceae bacterium]
MSGATHKVGGLCTGVLASALLLKTPSPEGVFLSSILIAGSYLGSLMPDIDHKGSTVGHKVKLISGTISKLFGHRGITHAPLFHLFIAGLMYLFVNSLETGILGL